MGLSEVKRSRAYTDAESGLIYLRARYYDPSTAQFLSRDPLVAMTRSAYGYVDNNPLNGTDPSGLNPWDGYCIKGINCGPGAGDPAWKQSIANTAGGVFNGIALGHGRGVLDNFGPTQGKVNYCDHMFGMGTKVGYGVDTLAAGAAVVPTVIAATAPTVTAVAGFASANPIAVGAAIGCGGGAFAALVIDPAADPNINNVISPVPHAIAECGVGAVGGGIIGRGGR